MSASLNVNRIQRFCLHDGPGLRSTLFLQGCSQRCWWCHNPDTIPNQNNDARIWQIEALLDELGRDAGFWQRGGGGLTVSGGEPLLQVDGLEALLSRAGERGWHRCIETAGQVPLAHVQRIAPLIDHWLFDLKAGDGAALLSASGGRLERIVGNLHWLLAAFDSPLQIRCPLINGFNHEPAAWEALCRVIDRLPRRVPLRLLPGHACGTDAARLLTDPMLAAETAEAACAHFRAAGIDTEITW